MITESCAILHKADVVQSVQYLAYLVEDRGIAVTFPARTEMSLFATAFRTAVWYSTCGCTFNAERCEYAHSLGFSAEVKAWSSSSSSLYVISC